MATQSAIIKINLEVDGGQKLVLSVNNLKELKAAIKQINDTRITFDPRSPQFAAASNQLKTLQGLYKGLAKDADSAEVQINQANAALNEQPKAIGYYRQLQAQLVTLKNQFKDLSETEAKGKLGQNLAGQINGISNQLKAQDALLGDFQRNVGNYKKGLLQVGDIVSGGLITGGIFAITTAVVGLGKRIIDVNAAVSDSVADVAKAANTSIQAIDGLAEKLKTRDTRTSLLDQLGIAEIGGKLGVAEKDLFGFVEAIDVVNVALGDQFGGSVELTTETVGKLRNVLLDIKTTDIGTDIVGIGNALNFLESQGAASAGTISDFAGRIGGVASPLGVSAGKILGVSATLDELAVNAERGSTAVVRILQRVSKSPDEFAKAIGVSSKEFTDLVNKDIFGAVTLVLQKLNDKKLSNTELQKTLGKLGLTGVGVSEVVGKLGANLDLLNTRVDQSTKSLGENSSVLQEFEKKNDTLAASIEKAKNAYDNFLTNSSNAKFIGNTLDFLIEKVGIFDRVVELAIGPTKQLFDQINSFVADFDERGLSFIFDPLNILGEKKKVGLKGLDVGSLKSTVNLTTGGLLSNEPKNNFGPLASKANTEATNENTDATDKNTGAKERNAAASKRKAEEDLGAADSIARLTKQVQAAQDALSKSAQSGIGNATANLVLAEQALARAKALETEARNPTQNLSEVQQAEAGLVSLGVSIDNPTNEADAQAQLDALALSLAGSVGVVMPVEIDQDQVRKDFEIQKYFLGEEDRLRQENADKEKRRKDDQRQQQEQLFEAGLNAASNFNSQLAANDLARINTELQASNAAIQEEFDKKREAAQGNAQVLANLDKQQKEKQLAAEKQAARERRNIAIKEATIAFFLGLIKAGGNPVQTASVVAAYALGLIAIKAQEFFAGGTVKDGIGNQEGVVKTPNMKPTRQGLWVCPKETAQSGSIPKRSHSVQPRCRFQFGYHFAPSGSLRTQVATQYRFQGFGKS